MKIYAILRYEYRDYQICAMTADKEKAKRLKDIFSINSNEAIIQEYEDDDNFEFHWRCDEKGENPVVMCKKTDERIFASGKHIISVYVNAKDEKEAEERAKKKIAEYKYKTRVAGAK